MLACLGLNLNVVLVLLSAETPALREFSVQIQILNLLPETIRELAVRQKCELFYTFEPSDWSPFCFIVKEKTYVSWVPASSVACSHTHCCSLATRAAVGLCAR